MSAGPVQRSGVPLWRKLVDDLTAEIRAGIRPPGSKLPSVAEVQETIGLSQSTTMRAYRELASQGLLVAVPGAGSYVSDPLPPPVRPVSEVLADHEARIAELTARLKTVEERLAQIEKTEQ